MIVEMQIPGYGRSHFVATTKADWLTLQKEGVPLGRILTPKEIAAAKAAPDTAKAALEAKFLTDGVISTAAPSA